MAERVVGQGSFGIVFQAKCLETGEAVAIKKVLQDKRYKNRELQTMRLLDHPNVVSLKHYFFSTTDNDELYLNLVLEYVPETAYRVARHYSKARMPMIYVKLYTYQVCPLDSGVNLLLILRSTLKYRQSSKQISSETFSLFVSQNIELHMKELGERRGRQQHCVIVLLGGSSYKYTNL